MGTIQPVVSIFCPAFNHGNYIRQCLDGFVAQKTVFPIEIIVQDDASSDNTAVIIKEYAEKYDFIIPILHSENYFSKGKSINDYFFKNAKGKYLAICEGDDYWTDPYKLQKQVDILETHNEYSYVCARYSVMKDNTGEITNSQDELFVDGKDKIITADNFFFPYSTKTLTVLFRAKFLEDLNYNNRHFGDTILFFHLLQYGNAYYINEKMGIYRTHSGGMWSPVLAITKRKMSYYLSCRFLVTYKNKQESVKKFHLACYRQYLWNILESKNIFAFIGLCFGEFKMAILGCNNYFFSTLRLAPGLLKSILS